MTKELKPISEQEAAAKNYIDFITELRRLIWQKEYTMGMSYYNFEGIFAIEKDFEAISNFVSLETKKTFYNEFIKTTFLLKQIMSDVSQEEVNRMDDYTKVRFFDLFNAACDSVKTVKNVEQIKEELINEKSNYEVEEERRGLQNK